MRYADPGVLPGLRDALRSLISSDTDSVWQLPDGQVTEALAVIGQARQLLEVSEVAVVREGVARGLPTQSSWSPTDWVGVHEGRRAPRPTIRHAASVVRLAKAATGSTSGPLTPPTPDPATGELSVPAARWFDGGRLNVAENCVDRHVRAGNGQ